MTNGHQLRLYNSLGRRVEDFVPSGDVTGMYSCGPTVYAYPHLGNMRAYVSADTVRRALRWKGYRVRHVVNITAWLPGSSRCARCPPSRPLPPPPRSPATRPPEAAATIWHLR